MKSVVITGVSTGIGWATTGLLVERGYRVFGSVRKSADADRLQREFGSQVVPLIFDVVDPDAVRTAAARVREALDGETLFGLVNNAGVSISGPLLYISVDQFREQLEINLIGVLNVTQAFAPLLGAERALTGRRGRIVNVSSLSGRHAYPFAGPYSASKFALEGFSESLRRELMLFGIDVIVIAPGAVRTPIWDKVESADGSRYAGTPYGPSIERFRTICVDNGRKGLPPERLAGAILHGLTTPKPKVRYTIAPNLLQDRLIPALVSPRTLDRMIAVGLRFHR